MGKQIGKFAALRGVAHFMEFSYNRQPKCPHCGEDFDIDRNEAWKLYDDDGTHEVTCPSCEMDFQVESHATWTFSTEDQDDCVAEEGASK